MENEKRLIDATPDDCIKKTKRKTNFAKIIVSGTAEKPYYDIMWFDYMDGQYHIGYGSYNLNFVFQWLAECFDVEESPTVDAVEVVHGRWIPSDIDVDEYEQCMSDANDWYDWECSVCHYQISYVDPVQRKHLTNYCPNCGAKMDGGKET